MSRETTTGPGAGRRRLGPDAATSDEAPDASGLDAARRRHHETRPEDPGGGLGAGHDRAHADVWLADVTAGYGDRLALRDVNLAVETGTLLAVVGPNGAGKSTLLKLIAGLLKPWSGRVEVLGHPAGAQARRVAYVPQAETVDWQFPVTVEDVVMMGRYPGLGPLRRPGQLDRRAVTAALEKVSMAHHAGTQIGQLSGGQRRRVFLARALAAEPDLFLLDEPVTGVDPTTQEDLMDILENEARRGKTVIASTHDLACAAQRFQRVCAINRTVIAHGPSSLVLDPDVLARIYGGHLLMVGGAAILDDAHHHDEPHQGETHFHDEALPPEPHRHRGPRPSGNDGSAPSGPGHPTGAGEPGHGAGTPGGTEGG